MPKTLAVLALGLTALMTAQCGDGGARTSSSGHAPPGAGSHDLRSNALAASGAGAAEPPPIIARPTGKPNVLFVLVDDQRADSTLCMPKMRALIAAKGVEFSNALGKIDDARSPAAQPPATADDEHAIHGWFQKAGYRTALIGKYESGYGEYLRDHPGHVPAHWDDWYALALAWQNDFRLIERAKGSKQARSVCYHMYAETIARQDHKACAEGADDVRKSTESYATDVLRDKAIAVIQAAHKEGRPFFLHFAPPAPIDAPRRYQPPGPKLEFSDAAMKRLGDCPFFEWRTKPKSYLEKDVTDKPKWLRQLAGETPQEALDSARQKQLVSVLAVEDALEAMIKKLKDLGIEDETIIVFSAENGYSWGDHGYLGKNCAYEECIRVPLIIYDLRSPVPGGKHVDTLVTAIDYPATFADLAGIPFTPDGATGSRSFKGLIDGKTDYQRDELLIECWGGEAKTQPKAAAGVRTKRWKYIQHYDDLLRKTATVRQNGGNEAELYDLEKDPHELDNLLGIDERALKDKGYTRGEIEVVVNDHVKRLAELTGK